MKKGVTEEMVTEMAEMRQKGESFNQIGKKYGLDHTTVMYWLRKRLGGELPRKKEHNKIIGADDKVYIFKKYVNPDHVANYNEILDQNRNKELERRRQCPHIHWVKKCSHCEAILGSERGDNDNYVEEHVEQCKEEVIS